MNGCDYCGRSLYLSEGDQCKGCGAPIHGPQAPAVIYDSSIFTDVAIRYLGTPRTNIPVNTHLLPTTAKISDS